MEQSEAAADAEYAAPPVKVRRRRARFSMLALVWMLTVAALGVGLYRAGQEVVPLRASINRLRSELGYFSVPETTKTYVRRTKSKLPRAWQWRLALPPGRHYALRVYVGAAPDSKTIGRQAWFDLLNQSSAPIGDQLSGEVAYEAVMLHHDDRWWLRMGHLTDEGQSMPLGAQFEWLSDDSGWFDSSDASYDRVTAFDSAEPLMLLNVERNLRPSQPAADDSRAASASVQSRPSRVVIWIDSGRP